MTASCYRRRGEYPQAKRLYEEVHRKYPENLECLRFLVTICKDAGLIEEANNWLKEFKKIEQRVQDDRHAAAYGGGPSPSSGGGMGDEDSGSDREETLRQRGDGPSVSPDSKSAKIVKKVEKVEESDDEVLLPGT